MAQIKTLFIVCLAVVVFIAIVNYLRDFASDWLAKKRANRLKVLNNELEQLCKEISTYPTPRLTTETIPQKFPSKEAAQAFGEKWSRGGEGSFKAKAIDTKNRDEDHPAFDKTSISGGMLYTYPALFFGMREAHREDDVWFLDFTLAKNQWLKDYLSYLKDESVNK